MSVYVKNDAAAGVAIVGVAAAVVAVVAAADDDDDDASEGAGKGDYERGEKVVAARIVDRVVAVDVESLYVVAAADVDEAMSYENRTFQDYYWRHYHCSNPMKYNIKMIR